MIETAKENPLSPYQYLTWLLRDAPKLAAEEKNLAEKLLPENAPQSSWDIPVKILLYAKESADTQALFPFRFLNFLVSLFVSKRRICELQI